jgi:hypothetical protein
MARSSQHLKEIARLRELATPVHEAALAADRSITMEVGFIKDPEDLPNDILVRCAAAYFDNPMNAAWKDEDSFGRIRDIDWRLIRRVMRKDYVYFGSSRMIELLVGHYDYRLDHDMAARWRPSSEKPYWADAVYQASVVSSTVVAGEATARKGGHFRRMLAKAVGQLPVDRPRSQTHKRDSSLGAIVIQAFHEGRV